MAVKLRDLGLAIKRLQMRHHRSVDASLAPLGITLVQWDALRHIANNPGASSHQLAELTFQTDQAFGTLSSRLLERGLIERQVGPGRAIRHHLSPTGADLMKKGAAIVDEVLRASFASLTQADVELLYRLVVRVLESPLAVDTRPPAQHEERPSGRPARPARRSSQHRKG
ncbi:MarR family winged helix-turn-helix transcriptional regulator [Sorangium sp. So ce1153]|uniref:MarR family winged helix-turn-helix transcriptional regulator n=1 Tax=Sorangium sp. So ce1153 TaxID=3133333 RepID=UPI003F64337C